MANSSSCLLEWLHALLYFNHLFNVFNSGCVKLTEVRLVTVDCRGGIIACWSVAWFC